MELNIPFDYLLKTVVHYISSCIIAGQKDIISKSPRKLLTSLAFPAGYLLSKYIRKNANKVLKVSWFRYWEKWCVKDEENTNDEDYSEEIDVPADNEIILDPDFEGNEGAINDDISYDVSLDNDGEYDNVYVEELPDPDKTAEAGDGDYVTTEDELKQTNPKNDVTSNIDVVPVEQETQEPTITIDTTYTEPGTIETVPVEQTYTINEQEAERAVEAMANGEAGNVVVNTDGSISFEAVENTETNSMTK